jgi:3-hydroxy-9,10-secoandrosta-1,3,5(10)-triene-9,17-dione monooxygenase
MGHTMAPLAGDELAPMMFIAPRSEWKRLDDWGESLGLRGSGSHSIRIDGFVPDHYTLPLHMSQVDVTKGTPGLELHGNPEYGAGQLSFMVIEDAVLAVGMAKGALDAYEELMKTRKTAFPPIQDRLVDPDFQYRYGKAAGMIATGEAATLNAIQQWQETAAKGPHAVTKEAEMRIAAICQEVVQLAWHAVEDYLFPTAGSSAVRRGERIERVWRDLSMLHTHAGVSVFLGTIAKRELAKARLNVA